MSHGKRPTRETTPIRHEIFLAGIIQGSNTGTAFEDQSYRERISAQLAAAFPALTVYCPVVHHPNSAGYSDDSARTVFLHHLERIRHSALMVAWLPAASIGTGVELWVAHEARVPVITVSPMTANWAIKLLSDRVFATESAFAAFLVSPEREPFGTFDPAAPHRTLAASRKGRA